MKLVPATLVLLLPGALIAAEETGKPAPRPIGIPLDSGHLTSAILGLILVVTLIAVLALVLRRFGGLPGAGKGMITIVGGVSLGARERAMLLQVGGTRLLVGVSPGRIQTLHVLSKEEWESTGDHPEFESQLDAALQEKKP